jgi:hypothetical protein
MIHGAYACVYIVLLLSMYGFASKVLQVFGVFSVFLVGSALFYASCFLLDVASFTCCVNSYHLIM